MKVYVSDKVEYWYDRSTKCWWCAETDGKGNQVGDARHAYSKREILIEVADINNQ
jgi:hypothetical protein